MKKHLLFLTLFLLSLHSFAQYSQIGNKLIGSDFEGNASYQGSSVALSSDGKIALVGGTYDNNDQGAVWIYTFNGSNYIQYGNKLVGTGAVGNANQGQSVSLSSDGKTALVGGSGDHDLKGAIWIYTFNGSNYDQVGSKLAATDLAGIFSSFGSSVSLSADGKTALIGAANDNGDIGAAWIYTFNGSNYIQYGNKLVGTGAVGNANQGQSVSLSSDGKTALVGGNSDDGSKGAVWIYTFDGSNYVQYGNKLVGTGAVGNARQGWSVSLSSDGKTALVGGNSDNSSHGAAWIFTFNGSNYMQTGNKLVGTRAEGGANQGWSVSLSSDGKTALIGGITDVTNQGAVWIYTFNGSNYVQTGNKLVGIDGNYAHQGTSLALSADKNIAIVGGYSDGNYRGAAWVYTFNGIVTINPQITFSGGTLTVGGPSLDLSTLFATNSSGIVSYNITDIEASLSGTNLTPIAPGQVTVTVFISSAQGFNAGSQSAIFTIMPIQTITGISIPELNSTITLYPNPTNGILNIEGDFDNVSITNIIGITVYSGNQPALNISHLNDGFYFARITRESKSVIKKIIKKNH